MSPRRLPLSHNKRRRAGLTFSLPRVVKNRISFSTEDSKYAPRILLTFNVSLPRRPCQDTCKWCSWYDTDRIAPWSSASPAEDHFSFIVTLQEGGTYRTYANTREGTEDRRTDR